MQSLTTSTEVLIRFNEADPLGIVWHGHYIRYFEDAREAFGKQYGLGYLDCFKEGVVIPIVHASCDYKRSLRFGETVTVEATNTPCDAAKINFTYRLFNSKKELVATGTTVQVFLDKDTQTLLLTNPPFFEEWKKRQGFALKDNA